MSSAPRSKTKTHELLLPGGSVYLFIDPKIVLHPRLAKQMAFPKDSTGLTNELGEYNYCELLQPQTLFQNFRFY